MKNLASICNIVILIIFLLIPITTTAKEIKYIPDEINMNISWKSLKRYNFYINELKKSFFTDPISKEYKKNFKSKVFFKSNHDKDIILPAKARITGDVLDHIDTNKNLSSFKIELERGNINNITKFRLLTDRKSHNDEIFWSLLIRELGFPSSVRSIVNSKINGQQNKKYFFEESYSKEFIEMIGFRNSPIIEMDDREMFYSQIQKKDCLFLGITGYKYNQECVDKIKKKIKKFDTYKIENKSFIQNPVTAQIAYKAILERNILNIFENLINSDFKNLQELENLKIKYESSKTFLNFSKFHKIHNLYGSHALNNYNIKFLYDPIYNQLIPVNWDSNINLSDKCLSKQNNNKKNFNDNKRLAKIFKNISNNYRKIVNKDLSKEMECLISTYLNNEKFTFKKSPKNFFNFNNAEEKILKDLLINKTINKFPIVKINNNFTDGELCFSNNNCKFIDFKTIKDFLGGDFIIKDKNNKSIYPYLYLGTDTKNNDVFEYSNKNENELFDIKIKNYSTIFLNTNNFNKLKELNIYFDNSNNSKLVIYNSLLENIRINVFNKNKSIDETNNLDTIRHDELLLTGCLTIIDSKLSDVEIFFENSSCEDAVNFIRTDGNLKKIKVLNSKYDAIDADSSNITFGNIEVNNALNDCVDFSFGNYLINSINVNKCKDKGISVGEKSTVNVSKFNSLNTKLSFASKDSSILTLNTFNSDISEKKICGKIYKKKQEFNGAKIILNSNIKCKIDIDQFSQLEKRY